MPKGRRCLFKCSAIWVWLLFSTKIHQASCNHFIQAQTSEFFHEIDAENALMSLSSVSLFNTTKVLLSVQWCCDESVSSHGSLSKGCDGLGRCWDALLWNQLQQAEGWGVGGWVEVTCGPRDPLEGWWSLYVLTASTSGYAAGPNAEGKSKLWSDALEELLMEHA